MRQLFLAVLLAACLSASAQETELLLGFDGELVAGRWNPLEFRSRDAGDITLTVTADQGDLRRGQLPARHTWHVPGGAGLSVLEDEIFLPHWQSLSWSASSGGRVVASGSLHPRELDDRPLAVIVSAAAAGPARLLPSGVRVVPYPVASLPERLAAWDPVRYLVLDGTTAPPAAAAVIAAAAAGADVLLLEPLPASYAPLRALAGDSAVSHYGAGRLLLGTAETAPGLLVSTNGYAAAVGEQLGTLNVLEPARPLRLGLLLPFAGAYALLSVVLLRVAGVPGAAAVLCLGIVGVLAAGPQLRPGPAVSSSRLEVRVSAGGLSRSVTGSALLDRQGGTLELPGAHRPLKPVPYATRPGTTSFTPGRWQLLETASRPELREATGGLTPAPDHPLAALLPPGTVISTGDSIIEVTPAGAVP